MYVEWGVKTKSEPPALEIDDDLPLEEQKEQALAAMGRLSGLFSGRKK